MAHIIKIGNSQGIRIPKPIVSIANLENQDLDFVVLNEGLLITPEKKSRIGWKIDKGTTRPKVTWEWFKN